MFVVSLATKIEEIEYEISRTQKNKGSFFSRCCRLPFIRTKERKFRFCTIDVFDFFFYPATNGHLGLLKAKLAKLRSELLEGSKAGQKGPGDGEYSGFFARFANFSSSFRCDDEC